VDSRALVNTIN